MEILLDVLVAGVGVALGFWSAVLFRKGSHLPVIEDVAEAVHLSERHVHDFRIAGKVGNKILRECHGCGRQVQRDT